jgi:phage protein D
LIPDCRVSVQGKKLAGDKDAALTRVDVDLDANLFGQCVLTFNDPKLALINGTDFASGTPVKVEIGFHTKLQQVFEGEVVALEPQFRRDMPPSLRVVCQENIHRLALSQMTRAFNSVDDKEIATRIAQEHGLTAKAPSGTKEHILQSNLTDASFLRRIAAKSGNTLRIEGKKLIIGPPRSGATVRVAPGDGLRKIKVLIKANSQVGKISVHGWDPKAKKEIVGTAKPQGASQQGAKDHGGASTLSIAGHDHTPADVATAESIAKGRLRKIAEGFVTAQVEMLGNPQIMPGAQVKMEKLGDQIDGTWRVEHAAHQFNKHGYWVKFHAVRIAKAQPPSAKKQAAQSEPPPPDVHVIAVEVKTIGGTLLVNHPVRILDPDTGEPIGPDIKTNDKGVLRKVVPEKKAYRIEILGEELELPAPLLHPDLKHDWLICHFVDPSGNPIAHEKVKGSVGNDKFEFMTDENGKIDEPADLGPIELEIKGQTFQAHSITQEDRQQDGNVYRFVVAGPPAPVGKEEPPAPPEGPDELCQRPPRDDSSDEDTS